MSSQDPEAGPAPIAPPTVPPVAATSPPTAPPTVPGALAGTERTSSWPRTLGIIAIAFGALGTLGGLWALAWLVLAAYFPTLPQAAGGPIVLQPQEWAGTLIFNGATGFVLGLLLLFAGVAVMGERRRGVKLSIVWAVLKMAVVVVNVVLTFAMQQASLQSVGGQIPGALPVVGPVFLWLGVVSGLAWGWALPVFMLIWFSRRRVQEETARWT